MEVAEACWVVYLEFSLLPSILVEAWLLYPKKIFRIVFNCVSAIVIFPLAIELFAILMQVRFGFKILPLTGR